MRHNKCPKQVPNVSWVCVRVEESLLRKHGLLLDREWGGGTCSYRRPWLVTRPACRGRVAEACQEAVAAGNQPTEAVLFVGVCCGSRTSPVRRGHVDVTHKRSCIKFLKATSKFRNFFSDFFFEPNQKSP